MGGETKDAFRDLKKQYRGLRGYIEAREENAEMLGAGKKTRMLSADERRFILDSVSGLEAKCWKLLPSAGILRRGGIRKIQDGLKKIRSAYDLESYEQADFSPDVT